MDGDDEEEPIERISNGDSTAVLECLRGLLLLIAVMREFILRCCCWCCGCCCCKGKAGVLPILEFFLSVVIDLELLLRDMRVPVAVV